MACVLHSQHVRVPVYSKIYVFLLTRLWYECLFASVRSSFSTTFVTVETKELTLRGLLWTVRVPSWSWILYPLEILSNLEKKKSKKRNSDALQQKCTRVFGSDSLKYITLRLKDLINLRTKNCLIWFLIRIGMSPRRNKREFILSNLFIISSVKNIGSFCVIRCGSTRWKDGCALCWVTDFFTAPESMLKCTIVITRCPRRLSVRR